MNTSSDPWIDIINDSLGLGAAVRDNDLVTASSLIDNGVDALGVFIDGNPLLQFTVFNKQLEMSRLLLEKNVAWNINAKCDEEQVTALHIACMNADLEMIRLLFSHNADPNIKSVRGHTPLEFFVISDNRENCSSDVIYQIVREFAKSGLNASNLCFMEIYQASVLTPATFSLFFYCGLDIKHVHPTQPEGELTALHLTARADDFLMTKLLLEHGADPSSVGRGYSVLDVAGDRVRPLLTGPRFDVGECARHAQRTLLFMQKDLHPEFISSDADANTDSSTQAL